MNLSALVIFGFLAGIIVLVLAHCEESRKKAEQKRRIRALKLADIDHMDPFAFEHYVCRLLVHRGFAATVTRASGDFGVDIVAQRNGQKYAIQVKRHSKGVSRRAVSDAVAGKPYYGCDHAMVVTNNYFTKGAKELAQSTTCTLIDRDSLAQWILDYRQDDGETAEGFAPEKGITEIARELVSWSSQQEPSQEEQPTEVSPAILQRKPSKPELPRELLEGIRRRAAEDHPGDYSTQLFIIDQQIAAYQELQEHECPPTVPANVFRHLKRNAKKDHPLDYSTQLFVLRQQLAAYDQIEQYPCPREVSTGDFLGIREMVARDHPDDYSTQLYVTEQQVDAYLRVRSVG